MPRNPENRFEYEPFDEGKVEKEPIDDLQEVLNRFTLLSLEYSVTPSEQSAWYVRDAGNDVNTAIIEASEALGTGEERVVSLTRMRKEAYQNAADHLRHKPLQEQLAREKARELDILISTYEE